MSIVRLLVSVAALALFGLVAVAAMSLLFSVQVRFDQEAELEMKGPEAPRMSPTVVVTVVPSSSAQAREELLPMAAREAQRMAHPATTGAADVITASIQPLTLTPAELSELLGLSPEPAPRIAPDAKLAVGTSTVADDGSLRDARPVSVSDLIKAAPTPAPDDDSFTSVRINRAGSGPSVHRVPRER